MNTRVYELAKKYELSSKELIKVMETLKIEVRNHMSTLDKKTIELVEYHFNHKDDNEVEYTSKKKRTIDVSIPDQVLMKTHIEKEKKLTDEKALVSTQLRVGVFVDGQNLYRSAQSQYGSMVDYKQLLNLTVKGRKLVTANAFIVEKNQDEQSHFISKLESFGYVVHTKDLIQRRNGSAKGDWDVGITIEIQKMLKDLDVVILVSGDGDFCDLVKHIKQEEKQIEVVAFEGNTAMDLKAIADEFTPITKDLLMHTY